MIDDQPGMEVGVNTTTFDLLAFHATSGAFGGNDGPVAGSTSTGEANNGIDITNVTISSVTEPDFLLGDVDMNGIVNILDISPFISVLSTGGFQLEADIDQNGIVNILDIGPFIALLNQ